MDSAMPTPSPTEQPIPRYDYASGKTEYVLRGLFYDSREEALACNKQRMPQMSGVANIQRNLAAKTMSCDRGTHRVNNPIWEEEKP